MSKTCTESNASREAFQRLSDILDLLRRECPWDRKQTMKSLRYLTIEEVHELSEAVVSGQTDDLKKELGDLAMHILFYCKIAEEQGLFSTADVYNAVCDKLIDRHPFIFHKDEYHGESWEQLKMREGRRNVLDGVPDSLPSLVKAVRMQEKVAGIRKAESGERRVENGTAAPENLSTLHSPLSTSITEEQFGDYLFALVDWGRRHGINADDALCGANYRFKQRHTQ